MERFSRRTFFKIIAISTIIPKSLSFSNEIKKNFGKVLISTYNPKKISGTNFGFVMMDLDNEKLSQVSTPFLLHSFEINPTNPDEVVALCKWTPEFYLYDLNSLKLKNSIKTGSADELFVGHGNFSSDGKFFFASVADYKKLGPRIGKGFINVYETSSGKKINRIASGGYEPHMSQWIKMDEDLLVLNTGVGFEDQFLNNTNYKPIGSLKSSIEIINVNSGKVLKSNTLSDQNLSFAHLSSNNNGDIFLIGGQRTPNRHWIPKAYLCDENLNLTSLELNEPEINDQMLSPKINKDGKLAGASSPWSNKIFFWDIKSKNLVKKFEIEQPAGLDLAKNEDSFVILAKNKIVLVDPNTFSVRKSFDLGKLEPRAHCKII